MADCIKYLKPAFTDTKRNLILISVAMMCAITALHGYSFGRYTQKENYRAFDSRVAANFVHIVAAYCAYMHIVVGLVFLTVFMKLAPQGKVLLLMLVALVVHALIGGMQGFAAYLLSQQTEPVRDLLGHDHAILQASGGIAAFFSLWMLGVAYYKPGLIKNVG